MPKYVVLGTIGVNTYEEVEADSPKDAAEKAACDLSLCHQCAEEGEVGEVLYITVLDESQEECLLEEDLDYHPPCPVCSKKRPEREPDMTFFCPHCGHEDTQWCYSYKADMVCSTTLSVCDGEFCVERIDEDTLEEQSTNNGQLSCPKCGRDIEWAHQPGE